MYFFFKKGNKIEKMYFFSLKLFKLSINSLLP